MLPMLGACDLVFGLDRPEVDAGLPDRCDPVLSDDYDDPTAQPCGASIPDPATGIGLAREFSQLAMSPPPGQATHVGCTTSGFMFDGQVTLEITQAVDVGGPSRGTYIGLRVSVGTTVFGLAVITDPTGPQSLVMVESTGMSPTTIQTVTYTPAQFRWVRLEPRDGLVVGSTSPDGSSFTDFGISTVAAPTGPINATVEAGILTNVSVSVPGTGFVDNFSVCH